MDRESRPVRGAWVAGFVSLVLLMAVVVGACRVPGTQWAVGRPAGDRKGSDPGRSRRRQPADRSARWGRDVTRRGIQCGRPMVPRLRFPRLQRPIAAWGAAAVRDLSRWQLPGVPGPDDVGQFLSGLSGSELRPRLPARRSPGGVDRCQLPSRDRRSEPSIRTEPAFQPFQPPCGCLAAAGVVVDRPARRRPTRQTQARGVRDRPAAPGRLAN